MDRKNAPPSRKVYVVDDEREVRDAIALLLSTADIEAATYESAETFLAAPPGQGPICIVLDYRLPGLSGLDLLRQLRLERPQASVVMVTGHGDIPTAVAAMRLGAFHFIEKPFDGEALLAAVEEALAQTEAEEALRAEAALFLERRRTLTAREEEVFELLMEGLPTKSIAVRLDITTRTAEHHRASVMRKLMAKSISHLMRMAIGVYDPSTISKASR